MDFKEKKDILQEKLNIFLSDEQIDKLERWYENFISYNSHTNLMSKGDIEVIFEKHVFDSLAINLWHDFKNIKTILDVGTGGGFPSVLLAICFPDKKIIANDSRIKKINFIKEIKNKLNLDNLEIIYSRIEEINPLNVDLALSRAVGKMLDVYKLSKKHLNKKGKFLIYKSKSVLEETEAFKKEYNNADFEVIKYNLPLKENYERNLVILK